MLKTAKKCFGRFLVGVLATIVLLIQIPLTLYEHLQAGEYSSKSWELVWPVLVSTLIAVFGTLVTSYVFLKDTLDRTVDEKPYYGKVIGEYRREKMKTLMLYSGVFMGISCYLILFQNTADAAEGQEFSYALPLYIGIFAVAALLVISVRFLYECINSDRAIGKSAQGLLATQEEVISKKWESLRDDWSIFVDNEYISYIRMKSTDTTLSEYLEVEAGVAGGGFDEEKFINRFSEWEKFILAFLDKTSGFQQGQTIEQRITIAAGYIRKLGVIQEIEQRDQAHNCWKEDAYTKIESYGEKADSISIQMFLDIYRLLSDYRDILQVKLDKKDYLSESAKRRCSEKQRNKRQSILYLFFLLRFYSSLRCLVTLPKIELFLPSAKLYHVDFYNVRFENTSLRASRFLESLFVRAKLVGSNLALSLFDTCNFYNADIRNCSLGNAQFQNCLMSEMIWYDVDVTGSEFNQANLNKTTFENSILVNVDFKKTEFGYVSFINCKLGQIRFLDVKNRDLRHSSFDDSVLTAVEFPTHQEAMEGIPKRYMIHGMNYFRGLKVVFAENGMRERKQPNIWSNLRKCVSQNLDMSLSSFKKTVAEQIRFRDMVLDFSVFAQANMQQSVWVSLCMKGCVMTGANLTNAMFTYVDMESCALADAILYQAKFHLVNLKNSALSGCHASASKWMCCMLDKSDMSQIDLTQSQVEYSSFGDTILTQAELTHTYFLDVIFDNSNGNGILSSYSYFKDCSFINAYLPKSNFNYTSFAHCDMELASMAGSTIEEALFEDCNFENSNFRGCCFIRVTFKDNRHISEEVFEKCTFINCSFEGTDNRWGELFKSKPDYYKVR